MTEDIVPLAELNEKAILQVLAMLESFCAEKIGFEDLLSRVFDAYGLVMNAQQYVLIGSTVRSCLSYLYTQGRLTFSFEENRMLWQRNER